MERNKNISKAVIARLPRYYRYLRELIEEEKDRISSEELSRRMGSTASQIRQDLNHFGGFGTTGYGYNVKELYQEIARILGADEPMNLIVIGAGNLGRAIVKYQGFQKQGFYFTAMFDVNEKIFGENVNGVEIYNMAELDNFVTNQKVDIVALTVPKEVSKGISTHLYELGIRYFWNFSHTDLELPSDAIIKNVHLLDSLLELSYSISAEGND